MITNPNESNPSIPQNLKTRSPRSVLPLIFVIAGTTILSIAAFDFVLSANMGNLFLSNSSILRDPKFNNIDIVEKWGNVIVSQTLAASGAAIGFGLIAVGIVTNPNRNSLK